jgi:hypothetical protein
MGIFLHYYLLSFNLHLPFNMMTSKRKRSSLQIGEVNPHVSRTIDLTGDDAPSPRMTIDLTMTDDEEDDRIDQAATQLCDCCFKMTGSIEGLTALTSFEGYKHHSGLDLKKSAESGCPCCRLLWARASKLSKGTWSPTVIAVDARGSLVSGRTLKKGKFDAFQGHKRNCLRYRMHVARDLPAFDLVIFADQRAYLFHKSLLKLTFSHSQYLNMIR